LQDTPDLSIAVSANMTVERSWAGWSITFFMADTSMPSPDWPYNAILDTWGSRAYNNLRAPLLRASQEIFPPNEI